jgi:hypothetical protein
VPTTGPRLRCASCHDFDLCPSCDRKNDEAHRKGERPLHNPAHVFVKSFPPQ